MTTLPTPTLEQLSLFDLIADVPGHFLRIKRTMIDVSHAIEEGAALATPPCHVFVGFQRLSLFAKQAARYAQLSAHWQHCWVFGVPDTDLPAIPNITPVAISPRHPLAKEWFVVADGPSFGSALLTADVSGFAIGDPSRTFMGLWSADPVLVRQASTRIATALKLPLPDWTINGQTTLATYDRMANQLVALHEERMLVRNRA